MGVVLFNGRRAVNYIDGFGLSPSQHELLAHDIERLVRPAEGTHQNAQGGGVIVKRTATLAAVLAFVSMCVVLAAGSTPVPPAEGIRMAGLMMLPIAIVAVIFVRYFSWRGRLTGRVRADLADTGAPCQAAKGDDICMECN